MKTRTMSQFVSAAAGLLLPVAVWAQDLGDQSNSGALDRGTIGSSSGSDISSSGSGSYNSGGTFSSGSSQSLNSGSQSSSSQPGTFSGGIMVQDGAAYVIHRLQNEMSLPDGSKIEPNGTIKQSDGSMRSLSSGQILTLDGRVMSAPFNSGSSSSSSSSSGLYNSNSTPGSSTSTNPGNISGEQSSSSSNIPPTTSSTPSNGLGGSSSSTLNNGSTSPSPADQSDGSGLAPGATSTDPTQDYTD